MSLYAIDGRCHNAEPGTYGHECGKQAAWVGEDRNGHRCGFCSDCKRNGHEARGMVSWQPYNKAHEIALSVNRNHVDRGIVDEVAMREIFDTWNLPAGDRVSIWRGLTNRDA
jgi:hypothetical protein